MAQRKPRIAVYVDIDTVYRNFVRTAGFSEIEKSFDVRFFYAISLPNERPSLTIDSNDEPPTRKHSFIPVSRVRTGTWWRLGTINHLKNQRRNLRHFIAKRSYVSNRIGHLRTLIIDFLGLPGIFEFYRDRFLAKMGLDQNIEQSVIDFSPDLILYPSLLGGDFCNDLVLCAKKHSIPIHILMNSWDNPTAKAFACALPDRLLVWGRHSAELAHEFMQVPGDTIREIGAPQFDHYFHPGDRLINREYFLTTLRLPNDSRFILYAGNGLATRETEHLRILEETLLARGENDTYIIYRPHPWRGGLAEGEVDFFSRDWRRVILDPIMEDFYRDRITNGGNSFHHTDTIHILNLMRHCDGLISPLSTMLLEAYLCGKPFLVFFPEYLQSNDFNQNLMHFKTFLEKADPPVCRSEAALEGCVNDLLNQITDSGGELDGPHDPRYFCYFDDRNYAERLCNHVKDSLGVAFS